MENLNTLRIAYWQYRNYRADLYPRITLDGTLSSLNRSLIEDIQYQPGLVRIYIEADEVAQKQYLSWLYYYSLRYMTLYDFETETPLCPPDM